MKVSKRFIRLFQVPYVLFKARLAYDAAVKEAESLHTKTGARYYVFPEYGLRLTVGDRESIRRAKIRGQIPRSTNMMDYEKLSFYITPDRLGKSILSSSEITERKRGWYRYVLQKKKLNK